MVSCRLAIAATFAVVLCSHLHAADPMVSLDYCTMEDESPLQCEEKLYIDLLLSYSDDQGPISFTISEVEGRTFEQPVEVQIQQVDPKFIYPLRHLHDVPYHPQEEVILVDSRIVGISGCIDDPTASDPTCGWAYADGRRIEHSQGFCCSKDMSILSDQTTFRGEEVIGHKSNFFDHYSTAHCYRPGDIYYSGFGFSEPIVADGINIRITIGRLSREFTLSHANPIYRSIEGQLQFFIVGRTMNLSGRASYGPGTWEGPARLDDDVLYLPTSPTAHPYTEDIPGHAMLVGRDMIDPSGQTCDKIGISYEGFRKQGGQIPLTAIGNDIVETHGTSTKPIMSESIITTQIVSEEIGHPSRPYSSVCSTSKAGDCLHNQLFHLHEHDRHILTTDPTNNTNYLIKRMATFENTVFSIDIATPKDNPTFEYWRESMRRARVVLEIDARNVFSSDLTPVQIDPPVGPIKPKS